MNCIVHGVAKSQIGLSDFQFTSLQSNMSYDVLVKAGLLDSSHSSHQQVESHWIPWCNCQLWWGGGQYFFQTQKIWEQSEKSKVRDLWEKDELIFKSQSLGFLHGSVGKESAGNVVDLGSIPGLGSSPGEGKDYPLQYSGLENSMDCIVHGVAKSQTWLNDFHFSL